MKKTILLAFGIFYGWTIHAQHVTDVSLFLPGDPPEYLNEVVSSSGDMYSKVGHHGPAVENLWVAYRFFFNASTAIDVYNKQKPGLELKKYRWYPTEEQQKQGAGCDMYRVGNTVGLGGVQLWEGDTLKRPDPVTQRIARVGKESDGQAWMEMISRGVPYEGDTVDVAVRVTVMPGTREALVMAWEMHGKKVRFATGINYHPGNKVENKKKYIAVWGIHPEDVSAHPLPIGGAIVFTPVAFEKRKDLGKQIILVSKPVNQLSFLITSASSGEKDFSTEEAFWKYVKRVARSYKAKPYR